MNEKVEILTEVYRYVNRIKVCLAIRDIPGIWQEINALSSYLVSVDVSPTPHVLDAGESAVSISSSHASAESTSQTLPKRTPRK